MEKKTYANLVFVMLVIIVAVFMLRFLTTGLIDFGYLVAFCGWISVLRLIGKIK
jgi:hypothetical protein